MTAPFDLYRPVSATWDRRVLCGHLAVSGTNTVSVAIGVLIGIPFISSHGGSLDRLGFEVTTGGAAGSVARVGLYDNSSQVALYPNALVVDGGEFAATVAGVKESVIAVNLVPGALYWACYLCGTAAPIVRAIGVNLMPQIFGVPATYGTSTFSTLTVALAYAALPLIYPAGAVPQSASVPAIGVRYAT